MSWKVYALAFTILLLNGGLKAQPKTYFPHHLGDMWEYFVLDGVGNDTLQVRVISDSIDPTGSSHFRHRRQFLNPIGPPEFPWYEQFELDTTGNVFAIIPPMGRGLLYKLSGQHRQIWILADHGAGYTIARIESIYPDTLFGVPTIVKQITYYGAQDTSDTTHWLTQYQEKIAQGFGTIFRGGGDLGYNLYLQGCVINGIVYGDTILVSVLESPNKKLPGEFTLYQNYPNPFNPTTTIKYDLPEPGRVSLIIYDVLGRKVAELVDEEKAAGYHSITWNAANVASGVYLARLMVADANGYSKYSKLNKLILMK